MRALFGIWSSDKGTFMGLPQSLPILEVLGELLAYNADCPFPRTLACVLEAQLHWLGGGNSMRAGLCIKKG